MYVLYLTIGILLLIVLYLLWRLGQVYACARDMEREVERILREDTNTPITLSAYDRRMARLAAALNIHLRELRRQRHRYTTGDRELKEAVTNISHDLRTPLTAMRGYLHLLEGEEVSPKVRGYLAHIENRTGAMEALTEELFRYSMVLAEEALTLQQVCLNSVLEQTIAEFYGALTGAGITPEISLPEQSVMVQANGEALGRVLSNVLTNALRYSEGDLRICLTEQELLTVSNTARGLSDVDIGRLFDRFYTVEAARNSHGLGLSIAKTLMERMNGRIWAEYAGGQFCVKMQFLDANHQQ